MSPAPEDLPRHVIAFLENPTEDDITDVQALYREARWWGDEPDDPEHIRAIIRGSDCFVTARAQKRIVGMGRVISDGVSDAYIQDVTVSPSWRRRGAASAMMEALLARMRKRGLSWLGLIAQKGSYDLYERVGFRVMEGARPYVLYPLRKN